MSKRQNNKISTFVRVDKSGVDCIPSNKIAALPEVKEMQKMASLIVKQKKPVQGNSLLALLLIPILVSGHIMIGLNPYHYFRLHRHDGQLLYLKVATYDTFFLFFTTIIGILIKLFCQTFV